MCYIEMFFALFELDFFMLHVSYHVVRLTAKTTHITTSLVQITTCAGSQSATTYDSWDGPKTAACETGARTVAA